MFVSTEAIIGIWIIDAVFFWVFMTRWAYLDDKECVIEGERRTLLLRKNEAALNQQLESAKRGARFWGWLAALSAVVFLFCLLTVVVIGVVYGLQFVF